MDVISSANEARAGAQPAFVRLRMGMATAVLASMLTLPRSFAVIKLALIAAYVAVEAVTFLAGRQIRFSMRVLCFYGLVAATGVVWACVGIVHGAEPAAIVDTLRLYVGWSLAYVVLLSLLSDTDGHQVFHRSIVISAVLIAAINVLGMADFYFQTALVSQGVREELDMFVGFHEGYVQITSHNIGSLLFIVPYLIAFHARADAVQQHSALTWSALAVAVALAALSGRRALWLCVALTPAIFAAISWLDGTFRWWRSGARRALYALVAAGVVAVPVLAATSGGSAGAGFLEHVQSAFSAEDERTIQRGYLLARYSEHPLMGTGFGIGAGYVRNAERPWIYELTYQQLLMNVGLLGVIFVGTVFVFYLVAILRAEVQSGPRAAVGSALLLGLVVFMVGAYSNPYLGSFDFLLVLAVLPYLASSAESSCERRRRFRGLPGGPAGSGLSGLSRGAASAR